MAIAGKSSFKFSLGGHVKLGHRAGVLKGSALEGLRSSIPPASTFDVFACRSLTGISGFSDRSSY
jgi:hypothetical protein